MIDIRKIRAQDVMTKDVIKVPHSMTLHELAKLLREKQITGVPVVDETGKLVGVVSQTDIIRFYATFQPKKEVHPYFKGDEKTGSSEGSVIKEAVDDFGQRAVAEIMTQETFAFEENVTIIEIAKQMLKLHMHRVIIVDEDMNLAGVVTTMDLVRVITNWEKN